MKKSIVMLAALSAGCAAYAATPSVSNVTLAQDPATRLVTVTYDLADADAIITLDVLTNGTASVGDANLTVLSGECDGGDFGVDGVESAELHGGQPLHHE